MTILSILDIDLDQKIVLIRVDFNVPIKNGKVVSDVRIQAALPTINYALENNAKVILMSHLGRPAEGDFDPDYSLKPVAEHLEGLLNVPVTLNKTWLDGVNFENGDVILCENVRFNHGESDNDEQLSQKMAALCDVFVMDAFGSVHRAHASTTGVAKYAKEACGGLLLLSELKALKHVLDDPQRPLVAIVGGAKVSSKLTLLSALVNEVDQLIVGGGIANTFLAASGQMIGNSLYEPTLVDEANDLMQSLSSEGGFIPLPTDVVVADEFSEQAKGMLKDISQLTKQDMILDVGPESTKKLVALLKKAKTIIWNGPVGVFEIEAFSHGTEAICQAIASSDAFSLAGGGDTLAAIEKYGIADKISYISTGGSAFLAYLEGKKLPAVAMLEARAKKVKHLKS